MPSADHCTRTILGVTKLHTTRPTAWLGIGAAAWLRAWLGIGDKSMMAMYAKNKKNGLIRLVRMDNIGVWVIRIPFPTSGIKLCTTDTNAKIIIFWRMTKKNST